MDLKGLMREVQGTDIETVLLAARGHLKPADGEIMEEAIDGVKEWLNARGLGRTRKSNDQNLWMVFGGVR